jgi:hypothetical protein
MQRPSSTAPLHGAHSSDLQIPFAPPDNSQAEPSTQRVVVGRCPHPMTRKAQINPRIVLLCRLTITIAYRIGLH